MTTNSHVSIEQFERLVAICEKMNTVHSLILERVDGLESRIKYLENEKLETKCKGQCRCHSVETE